MPPSSASADLKLLDAELGGLGFSVRCTHLSPPTARRSSMSAIMGLLSITPAMPFAGIRIGTVNSLRAARLSEICFFPFIRLLIRQNESCCALGSNAQHKSSTARTATRNASFLFASCTRAPVWRQQRVHGSHAAPAGIAPRQGCGQTWPHAQASARPCTASCLRAESLMSEAVGHGKNGSACSNSSKQRKVEPTALMHHNCLRLMREGSGPYSCLAAEKPAAVMSSARAAPSEKVKGVASFVRCEEWVLEIMC